MLNELAQFRAEGAALPPQGHVSQTTHGRRRRRRRHRVIRGEFRSKRRQFIKSCQTGTVKNGQKS